MKRLVKYYETTLNGLKYEISKRSYYQLKKEAKGRVESDYSEVITHNFIVESI